MAEAQNSNRKPVIYGAGAIGGLIGAYAQRAGHAVLLVDKAADHVRCMNEHGLHVFGDHGDFTVPVNAALPDDLPGELDLVLLAVKGQDTEAALDVIAPKLAASGAIVSLQNGLMEAVIARRVGKERVVGAFVNFAADYKGPGQILEGAGGNVYLGEIDGRSSARLERIADLIRPAKPVVVTDNILGYLWAKQAYASLAFATALVDAPIGDVLDSERNKRVCIALCREAIAVATALGYRLEPFSDFDPGLYDSQNRADLQRTFDSLQEYGDRSRASAKNHTGIWHDLVVRRRKTEVEPILGEMVRQGQARGVDVRLNETLVRIIHEIEDGERQMGWHNFDELEVLARSQEKWFSY
ncbi:MAG TPA: 2-dehydropantoate 2-reductase [Thermomicrobiales bacterium]|jgi:2-dehydropantoate 2-reductase